MMLRALLTILVLFAVVSDVRSLKIGRIGSKPNTVRQSSSSRNCFQLFAKSRVDDAEFVSKDLVITSNLQDLNDINAPGYISSVPISTLQSNRVEVAKTVVALAITFVTFKLKWEGLLKIWNSQDALSKEKSDALGDQNVLNSELIQLDEGVKIQDVTVGAGDLIQLGDLVSIETVLMYNGLPVEKVVHNNQVFGSDEVIPKVFGALQFGRTENNSGAYSSLKGMRRGGMRKLLLSPMSAFGEKGFAPYVPPNSFIVLDVTIR